MKKLLKWSLIIFVGLLVIGRFLPHTSIPSNKETSTNSSSSEYDKYTDVKDKLHVDVTWGVDEVHVAHANFTIINNSQFTVKDVEITCTLSGPSGTVIGLKQHTIYDFVQAGKKVHFKDINLGFVDSQSQTARCEITNFKPL